jgi:hypothetical protein
MGVFDNTFNPTPVKFGSGSSSSSSTPKSSFDWTGLGLGILTTGGGILTSSQQQKASQAQADALIAQGKSQVEVAKIMQETERLKLEALKSGAGSNTGGSKTLYIALGVGAVVVLGVVVFAVTRKK